MSPAPPLDALRALLRQLPLPGSRRSRTAAAQGRRLAQERWFYLLIAPWLLGFLLLQAGPIVGAFLLGLFEWPLPQPPHFVGLQHFQELLGDPLFARSLLNSAYFAGVSIPLALGLGLLLALLVNNRLPGIRLFRAVYLLPLAVSGVATALVWGYVFNGRFGPINGVLALLGIAGPQWLQSEALAMPVVIFVHLWTAGINMVIYLAALQGIPTSVKEAAALDGAGRWQRFRHIEWPLISPVTLYLLLVNLIGTFQVFTPIHILTGGGPNAATLTLPYHIYRAAFSWGRLGYASALASVLFAIVLLLTILLLRTLEPRSFYLWREG